MRTLARGATPIDFAYDIHSEVGEHCAGSRVNGVMVPLRTKLHNGDVVEILTNANQHPSKDWLEFVGTARARSRIRSYIRAEERKRSIKLGRDLFEKEMRRKDLSFARFLKGPEARRVLLHFGCASQEELFAQLGYGRISPKQLMDVVAPSEDPKARESLRPSLLERTVQKVTGRNGKGEGIQIEGMNDMLVRFAKCCNPVPGDPVTGWITRGRGVTVHRRGCARAMELDPQRRVEVSWAGSAPFDLPVSLRVVTADKPGILANVSTAFTQAGVNISEANCRTSPDGRAVNLFQFTVGDVTKLRALMRTIARIEGVQDVERV